MTNTMGISVPLLNEYKQDFFLRRFPRTISGGMQFKFGYSVPIYIYIAQFSLFIFPWISSALFTSLIEYHVISVHLGVYIYGIFIFVCVFVVHLTSAIIASKKKLKDTQEYKKKTFTVLDEEDHIEFDGIVGKNTITFLFPPKKYRLNILIHSGLSGVLCSLSLIYLLPSELGFLYSNNVSATVILFILGWLTVCIAQYSYTTAAPPELATYRALDSNEFCCHTRPFYVLVLLVFYVCTKHDPHYHTVNQALHAVMVALPLLWTLGILPPIDALCSWLMEQVLVIVFGGSPMATDLRLFGMLVLSIGTVIVVYFSPSAVASICVAACFGYILSTDVASLAARLANSLCRNKVAHGKHPARRKDDPSLKQSWRCGIYEGLYHAVVVAATFLLALLLTMYHRLLNRHDAHILGYIIMALTVFEKYSRDLQSVYLFFGTIRNPFYPRTFENIDSFARAKKNMRVLRVFHRFILNWASPFVMMAYLLLHIPLTDRSPNYHPLFPNTTPEVALLQCVAICRALRWVWQNTSASLVEISVTHLILTIMPRSHTLHVLGLFSVLFIVSFCRDRTLELANKFYFFILLIVTSISHKKLRRTSSPILVSATALLFPLVLFVIATSALLSVPLLALFTIPVFMIGFPRPKRFWPATHSGSGSVCRDTIYYQQLMPSLTLCLRDLFSSGSIGIPSAGDYYIARFQDKLSWITILEHGAGFCTVNVKGLELQETSCHTIEASHLDTMFKSAFDDNENSCVNTNAFSAVTPLDTAFINTYSSTRNVLTGIIDSPDNYDIVFSYLQKTLIWVLIKYIRKTKERELSNQLKELTTICDNQLQRKPKRRSRNRSKTIEKKGSVISIRSIGKQTARVSPAFEMMDDECDRASTICSIKRHRSASQDSSMRSFSESIFSDDFNESRTTGFATRANPSWKAAKSYGSMSPPQSRGIGVIANDVDSFIEDLQIGLPAVDISETTTGTPKPHPILHKLPKINTSNMIYKPTTNLANSAEFICPYSVNFSIPVKWRELPIDSSRLQKLSFSFPFDWYCRVLRDTRLKVIGKSEAEVFHELERDEVLKNVYSQLIGACSSVFEPSGLIHANGAHHLYKCYMAELPWNAMMDWLTEEQDLLGLVLKAFRYAFKLMLDGSAYGLIDDDEELLAYLQHYDSDWYIGVDTGTQWSDAVLSSKPNLFSLGQVSSKGAYTSHMLTTQHLPIHIARVNGEVIRGQWANLALELYYLTNDDDERYSIQAHPSILRNLTVQAADPPLGYPVYSTPPISIPTL